jgi:hypothetical protein
MFWGCWRWCCEWGGGGGHKGCGVKGVWGCSARETKLSLKA